MAGGALQAAPARSGGFGGVRLGQIALIIAMGLFAAAAVYISVLITERQKALDRVSRYNLAWSTSQATIELGRLEQRIAVYALTGTPDKQFADEVKKASPCCEAIIGDTFLLHQKIKNRPVDMLIGNSFGKLIARAEDIPLVRVGFPITDRANLHYFPIFGYAGAARLVEMIGNAFLERRDRDSDDTNFEMVL